MRKPKVVIHIEGGLVQCVISDQEGIEYKVIDHDIEGSQEGESQKIDGYEVLITQHDEAEFDVPHVLKVYGAVSNYLER